MNWCALKAVQTQVLHVPLMSDSMLVEQVHSSTALSRHEIMVYTKQTLLGLFTEN